MKDIVLPKVQKENGFTAIRIFCALIVVYEHFIVLTGINLPILELRGIAVNVFFHFKRLLGYKKSIHIEISFGVL